jgi:hypothetical protein
MSPTMARWRNQGSHMTDVPATTKLAKPGTTKAP